MPDYRAMAGGAASAVGIDAPLFSAQMGVESVNYNVDVIECRIDSPAGARGGAQIVPQWHPGVDPCDPPSAYAYAAALMKGYLAAYDGSWPLALSCYNAGPSATAKGIAGHVDGWPFAETVTYVSRIMGVSQADARDYLDNGKLDGSGPPPPGADLVFAPDVPDAITLQRNSWSCAVRSLYVCLTMMAEQGMIEPVTYGDDGPRDVYAWMVPHYDDSSVGLHDRTGSGVVEVLAAHGIVAGNARPVTLADVQARAGHQSVMIGGTAWGHWVAVRGQEADGTLILENPARGYMGIGDELRDSFDRLGPFAMVWLDVPTAPQPSQPDQSISALLDRLEVARASMDDGAERVSPAMTREQAVASLERLWANVDRVYRDVGAIGAGLRQHQ